MIPNILSIAGSDPSGGAGIQADIKAISANGGFAMTVITGLTAQNTRGVRSVEMVSDRMIAAQINAIRDDIEIHAVKIGMLGTAKTVSLVAKGIKGLNVPIVLDPVMVAKGGERLLEPDAISALKEHLLPVASIVTPNLPEAADLLGEASAEDVAAMTKQAGRLLKHGCNAVLLKGGHMMSINAVDVLAEADGETEMVSARTKTGNTHGTGCTLSSALATQLGLGKSVRDASRHAKTYVAAAIAAEGELNVGGGCGPIHHFFKQPGH